MGCCGGRCRRVLLVSCLVGGRCLSCNGVVWCMLLPVVRCSLFVAVGVRCSCCCAKRLGYWLMLVVACCLWFVVCWCMGLVCVSSGLFVVLYLSFVACRCCLLF